MLIYFKAGNYKSIKDPVTINFNATAINDHEHSNVVIENGNSLLKSILLYGHNASGKSKILDAFAFFKWLVTNSATELQAGESIGVDSFALSSATEDQPSFFEVAFLLKNKKYRYGFEVDKNVVHKEWLLETTIKKEYPVFLRINDAYEIDFKRFNNADDLKKRTRKNALFLSVAAQWNVQKAVEINEWFNGIMFVHGLRENSYRELTIETLKNKTLSPFIDAFIKSADLGINGITVLPIKVDDLIRGAKENDIKKNLSNRFADTKESNLTVSMHVKYGTGNEDTTLVPFDFDVMESDGTIKYFNISGVIIKAILENKIVIIDEFDARLHTLLTKAILKLFNSSKTNSKAQLLAACHDTALLDNEILRRDQIYFVEKDNFGATNVTSLVEYKSRKESPIDKNYLAGKFGAIPFIDNLEDMLIDAKTKK